MKKNKEPA